MNVVVKYVLVYVSLKLYHLLAYAPGIFAIALFILVLLKSENLCVTHFLRNSPYSKQQQRTS